MPLSISGKDTGDNTICASKAFEAIDFTTCNIWNCKLHLKSISYIYEWCTYVHNRLPIPSTNSRRVTQILFQLVWLKLSSWPNQECILGLQKLPFKFSHLQKIKKTFSLTFCIHFQDNLRWKCLLSRLKCTGSIHISKKFLNKMEHLHFLQIIKKCGKVLSDYGKEVNIESCKGGENCFAVTYFRKLFLL